MTPRFTPRIPALRPRPLAGLVAAALIATACSNAAPPDDGTTTQPTLGTTTQAITGDAGLDTTSGSVVWLVGKVGRSEGFCSGVVVSPHVVLTAAHCVQANATYSVFLGSDYTDAAAREAPENFVPVVEGRRSPDYSASRNLHDVGVLVTSAPIPRPVAPLNRVALAKSDVGKPVRIAGFGQTSSTDETIGKRRSATTTLAAYDRLSLELEGTPSFCLFDSGGPTFLARDGVEVVAGVHSVSGTTTCDGQAWDARVDVELAFLDGVIAEVEPATGPVDDDAGTPDEEGGEGAPTPATKPATAPAPAAPTEEAGGCAVGRGEQAPSGLAVGLVAALLLAAVSRARARS